MPVSILNDPDEGGEIAAVHATLETAPVAGRLRTLDALPTPRETARRIVETRGADGMMTVKGHASKTFETFESIHWETTSTGRYRETPTLEHGRIKPRSIEVFTPPAKMIHDPHVQPIVRVTRRVECKKSGKPTTEHASGRTSVEADRASPQQVLAGNRGPWGSKAITPSATPPSAKTTPGSGPATRPHTTRSSTPSPLPSSSTTRGSCPSPSPASPTPVTPMPTRASRSCTPSQDPADRAHTPTETASLRAGPPTRQASRSPRIRRSGPLAPRSTPPPSRRRPHISQSQTRTRRPAPRSRLRSHNSNKHGITLAAAPRCRGPARREAGAVPTAEPRSSAAGRRPRSPDRGGGPVADVIFAHGRRRQDAVALPGLPHPEADPDLGAALRRRPVERLAEGLRKLVATVVGNTDPRSPEPLRSAAGSGGGPKRGSISDR